MKRFTFLPGLRRTVLDVGTVQIGTDPERALVLEFPDPKILTLLACLDDWHDERSYHDAARRIGVTPTSAKELLSLLRHGRLLIDPAGLITSAADADLRREHADEAAALALRRGDSPADMMGIRGRQRVVVHGTDPIAARIADVLRRSGVGRVRHQETVRPGEAGFAVLVNSPQPPVLTARAHARRDLPYLVVASSDGAVNVGPLVVPGHTPCIACVELHHRDAVPMWRDFGADTAPIEATLRELAASVASCQVMQFLDGSTGSAHGATIQLRAPFHMRRRVWREHASCGCIAVEAAA